jgi:AraC-like DNA-binding protein
MLRRPFHIRARSAVLPPGFVALRSGTIDFVDAVARGSSDVALVDPTLAERDPKISGSLSRAHLGTVLYIRLTPEYAQAAIGMIRQIGSGEIVTYGYNDDPTTFAGILNRQSRANRVQHLLRALAPQIATLVPEVRRGIDSMNEYGDRIDSVDRLASVCGITRGTLWRYFRNAGIRSAWGFVAGVSMLRNFDVLVRREIKVIDIAHAVGLNSERALKRRCIAVSGMPLEAIRAPISIEQLAERIALMLTTHDRQPE